MRLFRMLAFTLAFVAGIIGARQIAQGALLPWCNQLDCELCDDDLRQCHSVCPSNYGDIIYCRDSGCIPC